MGKTKKPLWWIKLTNYEYWPLMVLYFPTLFYILYLVFKSRSLTFFTLANPQEEFGGFFGESKTKALYKVSKKYLPVSIAFPLETSLEEVKRRIEVAGIGYPLIIKPDWGERGVNVEVMNNEDDLRNYLHLTDRDSIIQEYIDFPIELGVFYHRHPKRQSSNITGIVEKKLMSVTGDGASTVEELMQQRDRLRFQIDRIRRKNPEVLEKVVAEGEEYLVEPIGNHNRGTKFLDGSHHITPELVKVFDDIASSIHGFYYGRFDVKVRDWDSLYKGEGIRVLEINGVYSEPAHMYDPRWKLRDAWKEIIRHLRLVYEVSMANKERGYEPSPAGYFFKLLWKNYFQNKQTV